MSGLPTSSARRCTRANAGTEAAPRTALTQTKSTRKSWRGEAIRAIFTSASGNGKSIGGLKVIHRRRMVCRASVWSLSEVYYGIDGELPQRQDLERIHAEA
jgi:hypothetical protein